MSSMYTMASVINGERVLKLFMSSSTIIKKERVEKAPNAAAACAENIVVTAAREAERISSPNVSLLGGTQRPRQKPPQAAMRLQAARDTLSAWLFACEM